MTATAHALVAGMIAAKFSGDPVTASLIALGSHYMMDSLPHWDFGTNYKNRSKSATGALAILDTTCGIAVTFALFWTHTDLLTLSSAIFFSELPDWSMIPWFLFWGSSDNTLSKNPSLAEKCCYYVWVYQEKWFHKRAQLPLGGIVTIATLGFFYLLLK